MMGNPILDISLVSGRRPTLLSQTLASFSRHLFSHFSLGQVLVNIDPFGGDEADHDECRLIVARHFPDARISEPEKCGFGTAVKHLWSQASGNLLFHLEDDWLLREDVTPERVLPLLTGHTRGVSLVSREIGWTGRSAYNTRGVRTTFLGLTVWRSRRSAFGTSPGFLTGDFARRCGELMDPGLDPEKQLRPPFNPPLADYTRQFDCRFLPGRDQPFIIEDIGRQWRLDRRIDKITSDGLSVWTVGNETSSSR